VAERLQAPLITADPKFIERAAGLYPSVQPLLPLNPRANAIEH
jgi:hypothetical protein